MAKRKSDYNDQEQAAIRLVLTDSTKELMMAVLIRNVKAFEAVRAKLTLERLEHDPQLWTLWLAVGQYFDDTGILPPSQEFLMREVQKIIDSDNRQRLSHVEIEQLSDFITMAFNPDTFGDEPCSSDVHYRWALDRAKEFLEERIFYELRDKAKSHSTVPTSVPTFMSDVLAEAERLVSFEADAEDEDDESYFIGNSWSKPTNFNFRDVGIGFIKKFMGRGQVPGEVYGFMGPYGSCKTTVAVMLAAESARAFYREHRSSPDEKPKIAFIVTYEDGKRQLQHRAISYAAEIPRDRMEGMHEVPLSTTDELHPYEKKKYNRQLQAGEKVPGETERANHAITWLNAHMYAIDMSGQTKKGCGAGGIHEIARAITKVLRDRNAECGLVVIDYVGAMVRRQLSSMAGSSSNDEDRLRHRIAEAPLMSKNLLAVNFGCPVWLMHQLSGDANSKGSTAKVDHTNAAEAKNFAENLDFCFCVGRPTLEQVCMLRCTKHRRQPPRDVTLIQIKGRWNRVIDGDKHFCIVPGSNRIQSRAHTDRLGSFTAPEQDNTHVVGNGPSAAALD